MIGTTVSLPILHALSHMLIRLPLVLGAKYINHYAYVAQAYEALGETVVNEYYPLDHTHTSVEGANVVAEAFVRGIICGNSGLAAYVNSAGQAVPSTWTDDYY